MFAVLALAATAGTALVSVNGEGEDLKPKPTPRRPKPAAIKANLSRNHPDYGLSPSDHAKAKAAREDT